MPSFYVIIHMVSDRIREQHMAQGSLPDQFKYFTEKLLLSQKLVTSEGAVTHNVLYYQQLSNARYQVSFYAHNYFEL